MKRQIHPIADARKTFIEKIKNGKWQSSSLSNTAAIFPSTGGKYEKIRY